MKHNQRLARAIGLVIATGSFGVASQALAQDESDSALLESVAVTGSRIKHDVYAASQPIDIVVPEAAAAQGIGSVSQLLQTSTIAAGSAQVTAATSTAFVQAGGTGAQTLSLRGLGANRTLVLLNGRRAGPAGTRGEVSSFDFNVLPLSVVERVEILKDGASSIYGSDAVAGVVNVITKKSDGAEAEGFVSVPNESGGEESRFNISWGRTFDRGNFRITGDYHREDELKRGDRDYFSCGEDYVFSPDTGERRDRIDPRTGRPMCTDLPWGHIWVYDYNFTEPGNLPTTVLFGAVQLIQFDYDGDLGQYIPGLSADPGAINQHRVPPGWFPVEYDRVSDGVTNNDHPFQDGESLIPRMERATVYADGELNLTDSVTAYAEVLLNRRKTRVNGYRQYWSYKYTEDFNFYEAFWNYTYSTCPGCGDPQSAGWTGAQYLSPTPITDHADSEIDVDYQRYVAGLRGDLKSGWSWDISLQYSHSSGDYTEDQIFNDSIRDTNITFAGFSGVPYVPQATCVGTVSSVRGAPCVDIPWFDPAFLNGEISPEVREFLFGRETGNTQYDQMSAEAYITGRMFDLPAGPVGVAFGLHYQEDEIRDVPGEITLAGNAWNTSSAGITEGDDRSHAVFAEIELPLLVDKPLADSLTLTASGRYTDVDSYGSGETYKVGLNWAITPSLRLRASQGTSFRAPALFELYLADQTSFLSQRTLDPCHDWGARLAAGEISQRIADNCAADGLPPNFTAAAIFGTVITGGGLGVLEAETSTSKTIGLVWRPSFADLSVSVDYFDIEVKDEVDQLGAQQIVFNCYDSEFFPDEPLCDLFERVPPLGNMIDNIHDSFINIARQTNRGFDVAALWRTSLPWGNLTIETQHTFQEEDVRALFAETPEELNGLVGDPEWNGRLNLTFDRGPWSYFWGMQFVGSSSNQQHYEELNGTSTASIYGEDVRIVLETDDVIYHSASVTREFEDWGLTVLLGAANILDEEPPRVTTLGLGELETVGNSAFYSQYDWVGRRFFLNVTKTF
jgi:outer membrane receptor protein involved in Fe transport